MNPDKSISAQQSAREILEARHVVRDSACRGCRQIVEGYRNRSVARASARNRNRCQQKCRYNQRSAQKSHRSASLLTN